MGDHRVSIKLEFSMHGHEAKNDWWLNWSDNIPERVAEWVEGQKSKAMDKYFEAENLEEERRAALLEDVEREQLAKLKAKYEPRNP
jgi:hypothetical protein